MTTTKQVFKITRCEIEKEIKKVVDKPERCDIMTTSRRQRDLPFNTRMIHEVTKELIS